MPNFLKRTAKETLDSPFKSLGIGFVSFILLIVVMIIAFITIIGFKIGLYALLALGAFFIFFGAFNAYFITYWLINKKESKKGKMILYFIGGLLIYEMVALIPFLGGLMVVIVSLMSLGALYTSKKELYLKLKKSKLV